LSDTDLLIKIAGDIGALKKQGETQTNQIAELFNAVSALKDCQAESKGMEKGKSDITGRLMSGVALICSLIVAWLSSGGRHPGP